MLSKKLASIDTDKIPEWAYKGVKKFYILNNPKKKFELTITDGSRHVKITKGEVRDKWEVRWLIFNHGEVVMTEGFRLFSSNEVRTAFHLIRMTHITDEDFAKKYKAGFGIPGQFIRRGSIVNIPCPGTGHKKDPNITVLLNEEISFAIECFIKAHG